MSEAPRIREANAADADALARLSGELGYPAAAAAITRRLADIATAEAGVVLVAVDARDAVLGFAQVEPRCLLFKDPFVELAALVVDAEARGRGAGAALLAAVEAWTRAQGFASVRVRSNVLRERAHRFYLREGYAESKRQVVFEKRVRRSGD